MAEPVAAVAELAACYGVSAEGLIRALRSRDPYPGSRLVLKSDTIEACAIRSRPDEFLIRLDDEANRSTWVTIRLTHRAKT